MRTRQHNRLPNPAAALVPWTYELPPEGGASEGLEGYSVEALGGERVGSVLVVLRHGAEQYLAVRRSWRPRHDLRLVRWSDVAFVDHAAHRVGLGLSPAELGAALRLAPGRGTHGDDADAVRVPHRLDAGVTERRSRTDRLNGRVVAAVAFAGLGLLTLLGAFAFVAAPDWRDVDLALFALPAFAFLAAAASVLAFLLRERA